VSNDDAQREERPLASSSERQLELRGDLVTVNCRVPGSSVAKTITGVKRPDVSVAMLFC